VSKNITETTDLYRLFDGDRTGNAA